MQGTDHAIAGLALIVLYKDRFTHFLVKFTLVERFEEVATGIFEKTGFDDDHAFKRGFVR